MYSLIIIGTYINYNVFLFKIDFKMFNRGIPLLIIIGVLCIIYAFALMFTGDWENGIGYFLSGIASLILYKIISKIRKWWRDWLCQICILYKKIGIMIIINKRIEAFVIDILASIIMSSSFFIISEDTTPNVHLKTPSNVQRRTLSNVHLITLQMYSFNQVAFWL